MQVSAIDCYTISHVIGTAREARRGADLASPNSGFGYEPGCLHLACPSLTDMPAGTHSQTLPSGTVDDTHVICQSR
ncbi:hypothetical protein E2C01_091223 [Portunus trituberculatus]|uniref:Uncharacterized protein n=1 Tax=Portunus trituberculatus TaxID=210409 RepID=A0A5B7JH00_PORTR|nr:hypothetical protein [Portunus trituberculatus]